MAKQMLKAGAAVVDITPALGGSMAGYFEDRRSTYVHDPLHARCLVLDNGQEQLAIVVCELIVIAKPQAVEARRLIHEHTGIPLSNIVICAVHTHTAATPAALFQAEPDPAYLTWVVSRIVDAARCAVVNLRPARIGWGLGSEPSLVFNRRYCMKPGTIPADPFGGKTDQVMMNPGALNPNIIRPAGPTDPELGVLAVQHEDGAPLAVLGNYALHYVGNCPDNDISADYFAMWGEEIARLLEVCCSDPDHERPRFVAAMSNGCSGNVNNIDVSREFHQPYPYHHMRKVARQLAEEAHRVWQGLRWRDWVPLGIREATLEFGVRKPTASEIERANRILAEADGKLASSEQVYAHETVSLARWPDRWTTTVQAIRIGDLGLVTFPGEAFVELGLEVKRRSPFKPTFCIDLANDYAGYIPTAEAHELGGYETWRARSSFLEKSAGSVMVAKAMELLNDLRG